MDWEILGLGHEALNFVIWIICFHADKILSGYEVIYDILIGITLSIIYHIMILTLLIKSIFKFVTFKGACMVPNKKNQKIRV